MKKIIAVLLSMNRLVLNASPVLAQVAPRKLTQGAIKAFKVPGVKFPTYQLPAGVKISAASVVFDKRVEQAALNGLRLPLTQNYAALLGNHNPLLPPARQILAHNNAKERALLLRSDFVALALDNKASQKDIQAAANFYRNNLKAEQKVLFEGMVLPAVSTAADIASLGILGNQKDGELIYQTALKAQTTAQEALVTAAAARALLRLEAYEPLEALSRTSTVQPQLWEGLAQYAQDHKLPLYIFGNENGVRQTVDVADAQKQLAKFGPLNQVAVNPSLESTYLYMNAGRGLPKPEAVTKKTAPQKSAPVQETVAAAPAAEQPVQTAPAVAAPVAENLIVAPIQSAALAMADKTAADAAQQAKADLIAQTKNWLTRLKPKGLSSADDTKFTQRAALYLTAFSIGLEIGTPIMASVRSALNLPLSIAVLITVATYSPYLFGSFLANWAKGKIGRKGTVNAGIGLMAGSFAVGATTLGLDGSFTPWDNQMLQFLGILGALTAASTGSVFIHNAVGPVMTEISHKASELVRQKRGTYVELSRSIGMMASFAFPFIATSMLGMDWSAPFILALPIVGASALTLNLAKLPNTKPQVSPAPKLAQSPVMDGLRKPRKAMAWKDSLFNNSYVRLLREEPGVGSFISSLFIMNAVEMGINSGFLFMLPQLTKNESDQYLFGMFQFAVPFLIGRYLAAHFLKWFPNRNISGATLLASACALASLPMTNNVYALTAALFTAELGISTSFTLAFARTAKNHLTQDRVTSLIMATAVSCAVGPLIFSQLTEALMNAGLMGEIDATVIAMIGLPGVLGLLATQLMRRMENKTIPGLKFSAKRLQAKVKNFFIKK